MNISVVAYFISDIHILGKDDPKVASLVSVLQEIRKQNATHLFLLGDIFDLWVGGSQYFADTYSEIVNQVRELVSDGVEVHYVEGNHDFHLKDFWSKELGVHVHADDYTMTKAGKVIRVEHGDFINPDDHAYLKWRALMRSGFIKYAAKAAPGWFTRFIGDNLSRLSRKRSRAHSAKVAQEIETKIEVFSEKRAREFDYDLLVSGHVHVEKDYSFTLDGKERRSVNLGFWDRPKAFKCELVGEQLQCRFVDFT